MMMGRLTRLVFCILPLLLGGAPVWAQVTGAQVPEEKIGKIIYVDQQHPQASDHNPGSEGLPLKTISKAAEIAWVNNRNNVGTKVLISPGVYRESIDVWQETDAPIVFEAREKGRVVVSGSDVWSGWQRYGATNIYTHLWPYNWGLADVPPDWQNDPQAQKAFTPIVRRREMIFVNGSALEQVLSYAELKEKSFYVDEAHDVVYLWPPAGTSIATTLIEVAVRSPLFLALEKQNLVLRGLVFQHANNPLQTSAVDIGASSNVLVEDCVFSWNNWGGLNIGGSQNVTARRNVANNNGGTAMGGAFGKNYLFEDNETSYNNWRGVRAGFTEWAVAGLKHLFIHDAVYRRHKAVENKTLGFWLDTDNANVLIEGIFAHNNLVHGIAIEASQGPITVKDSIICHNQGDGLIVYNFRDITLENTIIYGNAGPQIEPAGWGRQVINWETKEEIMLRAERLTVKSNVIVGKATNQFLLKGSMADTENSDAWMTFVNSLSSDSNTWYDAATPQAFQLPGGRMVDFRGWQSTTGQDSNSRFADPRFTDPDNHNFSFLSGSLLPPAAPSGLVVTP